MAAAFVTLGMVGGFQRSNAFSYGWNLKPVSATEKWLRVFAEGDGALGGFAIRGVDFTITGATSVRSSGGPAPTCALTGSPAALHCDGSINGGSSVFVRLAVSGAGTTYEISVGPAGAPPFYQRDTQGPPFLPMSARLTHSSATRKQVRFTTQGNRFKDVEVVPFGFRVTRVVAVSVGGRATATTACKPQGPGLDCTLNVAARSTGIVTIDTATSATRQVASAADDEPDSAEVLLHGEEGTAHGFVFDSGETAAKYDLVARWSKQVLSVFVNEPSAKGVHFQVDARPRNSPKADVPSRLSKYRITASGTRWVVYSLKAECDPKVWVPSLGPGEDTDLCEIVFRNHETPSRPGVARLRFQIECDKALEKNCTNNIAVVEVRVHRR